MSNADGLSLYLTRTSLSSLVVPLDLVDNMTTGGCLKQLRKIYELKRPEPNEVIAVF